MCRIAWPKRNCPLARWAGRGAEVYHPPGRELSGHFGRLLGPARRERDELAVRPIVGPQPEPPAGRLGERAVDGAGILQAAPKVAIRPQAQCVAQERGGLLRRACARTAQIGQAAEAFDRAWEDPAVLARDHRIMDEMVRGDQLAG